MWQNELPTLQSRKWHFSLCLCVLAERIGLWWAFRALARPASGLRGTEGPGIELKESDWSRLPPSGDAIWGLHLETRRVLMLSVSLVVCVALGMCVCMFPSVCTCRWTSVCRGQRLNIALLKQGLSLNPWACWRSSLGNQQAPVLASVPGYGWGRQSVLGLPTRVAFPLLLHSKHVTPEPSPQLLGALSDGF